jgi:hypothetical protein
MEIANLFTVECELSMEHAWDAEPAKFWDGES